MADKKEEEKKEAEVEPPATRDAWQKSTDAGISKAANAVRDMQNRVRQNELDEEKNKAAAQAHSMREFAAKKEAVLSKAAASGKVIDTSFACMQEIEDATLQMEDSFTKLKHERMQGFASLQVCTRRIDVRAERPKAEMFNDPLTEALNSEKACLEGLRAELFALEKGAKTLIDEMTSKRTELSQDIGERRLEMAEDLSSLKPAIGVPSPKGKKAGAKPQEGGAAEGAEAPTLVEQAKAAFDQTADKLGATQKVSPAEKAADKKAEKEPAKEGAAKEGAAKEGEGEAAGGAAKEGEKPPTDSKALMEATQALLARCRKIRADSFVLVDKSKLNSKLANARTEEAMQKRIIDLANKKKNLETQQLDVENAITAGQRNLDKMCKRVDPNDKERGEKLEADKKALVSLRNSQKQLQTDIRAKMKALDIDNLCRRVTPAKADSAKRQAAAASGMQKSGSAPALRGTQKDLGATTGNKSANFGETGDAQSLADASTRAPSSGKPPSPAGGSSTLKSVASAVGVQ